MNCLTPSPLASILKCCHPLCRCTQEKSEDISLLFTEWLTLADAHIMFYADKKSKPFVFQKGDKIHHNYMTCCYISHMQEIKAKVRWTLQDYLQDIFAGLQRTFSGTCQDFAKAITGRQKTYIPDADVQPLVD